MNEYEAPSQFFASCDSYVSQEELKRICLGVSSDFVTDEHYKIVGQSEYDHEFGTGGYNKGRNVLLEDNKPIIVSIQRIAWGTTSDDYEDYVNESMQKTFLLENYGPDTFVGKIFEAIKQVRPLKTGSQTDEHQPSISECSSESNHYCVLCGYFHRGSDCPRD